MTNRNNYLAAHDHLYPYVRMVIIASSSRGNWTCASTKSRKDGHFLPINKIQYGKREPAQAKDKEMTNQNYYLAGGGSKSPDVCMIVIVVLSVGLDVVEGQLDLHQQQHEGYSDKEMDAIVWEIAGVVQLGQIHVDENYIGETKSGPSRLDPPPSSSSGKKMRMHCD
jgi:hypothetical protein